MDTYVLNASSRTETGKAAKRLRQEGRVPGVIYGHGFGPEKLEVVRGELEKVYRKAGSSSVVVVKLGSDQHNALIQDVQHHPTTGKLLHVDLYQVRMDEKIKAEVPLVFEGTAPAVRELDGVLVTNLNEIEVECLPGDLPHEITVSIDALQTFDDTISIKDLVIPSGVEVLTEADTNIALVTPPRTQEELEELDEEAEVDTSALAEEGAEEASDDTPQDSGDASSESKE